MQHILTRACGVLLAIPKIVLCKHIALATSEQEGRFPVGVGGIESIESAHSRL